MILPADTDVRGRVTIGAGTVVHPRAKIDATLGPITVGENCLLEEHVHLISTDKGMTIGDGNVFRVHAHVSSPQIGNCNVFETGCHVSDSQTISNFCILSAGCKLGHSDHEHSMLPERTVVYGHDAMQHVWSGDGMGQHLALHAKHLQYLRDTIPRSHKLRVIRS